MKAFHRVQAILAAIQAVFAGKGNDPAWSEQLALAEARKLSAGYESHGHGGKTPRTRTGIAGIRRAALKRRNQARHRVSCRGGR